MSHAGQFALDNLTILQAFMASATGTTQPQAHVWYYDVSVSQKLGFEEYRPQLQRTTLDDTNTVDICSPPTGQETVRTITKVAIINRSTDTEIITVATSISANSRRIITMTLLTLQGLYYEQHRGWYKEGG